MRDRTRMIKLIREVNQLSQPMRRKERKEKILSKEKIETLVQMLQMSQVEENPYTIEFLQKEYEKTPETEKELFTVDTLFTEGYLLYDLDEWRFNIEFKNSYCDLDKPEREQEKQILQFLIELSKVPYEDQLQIKIICPVTGMDDFVQENAGNTIIGFYAKGWEKYGDAVLGIWWDQIQQEKDEEERKRQTQKWFLLWNRIQGGIHPEYYMEHTSELYEICLEKLEKEYARTNSQQTKHIYERNIWLRTNGGNRGKVTEWFADYPSDLLQQLEYTERKMQEAVGTTIFYRNLSHVLHFCMQNIEDMDEAQKQRLYTVLTVPYPYETLIDLDTCPEMLVFGMEQRQLFPLCAGRIIEKISKLQRTMPEQIAGILEQVCKDLFSILEEHAADRHTAWTESLVSFQWYLNRESGYGWTRLWNGENQKIPQMVRNAYGQWYEKKVCKLHMPLHKEIVKVFTELFEQVQGMKATQIFVEIVWLLGMEHTAEAAEETLLIYVKYQHRIPKDDMIISQMNWKFWQEKIWRSVMKLVAESPKHRELFLHAFTISVFQENMNKNASRSPVLYMGKAGMIQLYLFTVLFLEEQAEMGESTKKQMEKVFFHYIYAFLEDDKLFQPLYVNSMDTGNVVQRVTACIETGQDSLRAGFVRKLETADAAAILMFLEYSRNHEMRTQLMEILQNRMDEAFTQQMIVTSTWQKMIQQLLVVAEKEENPVFAKKAEQLTDKLEAKLKSSGEAVFQKNKLWLDSIRAQIAIALEDEETLRQIENGEAGAFYQGYVKLNSEKLEDIKAAEEIYRENLKEHDDTISYYINAMASCVRIAAHEESSEEEKADYSARARQLDGEIQQKFPEMSMAQKQIIWENKLYLSLKEHNIETFWTDVKSMPTELWDEISCVKYIVEMYWNMGEQEKVRELLDKMKSRYGDCDQLRELESNITKMILSKSKIRFPVNEITSYTADFEEQIRQMQNLLPKIKSLQPYDSSRVYFQRDDLQNPVETYLMVMLLRVVHVLEENVGLLIRENKTAEENTYSKMLQILFNRAMSDVFGFSMMDQSQGGATGIIKKNGEDGVGSMDLCICKDDTKQVIIEVVKVTRYDKKDLRKHVLKLPAYNYAQAPVLVHLILTECAQQEQLWENYVKDLKNYWKKSKEWEMLEVIEGENTELAEKHLLQPLPRFLLLTRHRCIYNGREVHMYHVMVDIKKENEKELAKAARTRKSD